MTLRQIARSIAKARKRSWERHLAKRWTGSGDPSAAAALERGEQLRPIKEKGTR